MLVTKDLNKLYLSYRIREWETEASTTILNYLLEKVLQAATSKCSLVDFGVLDKSGVCQEGRKLLGLVIVAFPPAQYCFQDCSKLYLLQGSKAFCRHLK